VRIITVFMAKIIITGAAGFIGFHLAQKLLEHNHQIIAIDNLNDYYDISLKQARLEKLERHNNFTFYKADISDKDQIFDIFKRHKDAKYLFNLAAQAGVRYSIESPFSYIKSNVDGLSVILEGIRNILNLKHLIFASSSSVYGNNKKVPFSIEDRVDEPVSLYAATKKSGEMLCHSYANLYQIPTTALRFFTVYGPFGRPDMAYFSFTKNIIEEKTIKLFNNGNLSRDFTYIDDIIAGLLAVMEKHPSGETPYKLYNLGNNNPVELKHFIEILESHIGKKAKTEMLPMQKGDVYQTYADITQSSADFGYSPKTSIEEGLSEFVKWYKEYYKVT
jgi:UDP-glucuronate 4-epimerase